MGTRTASLGLALILGHATLCLADSTRSTMDVWPGAPPAEVASVGEETAKTTSTPSADALVPLGQRGLALLRTGVVILSAADA
jgi:hypothetical protein